MSDTAVNEKPRVSSKCAKEILSLVAPFEIPQVRKSLLQILNSFGPFFVVAYFACLSVARDMPYLLTLALAALAGGFLVRIFVIQHDCGHGSFFPSRRANDFVGVICSFFTLIPYFYWRRQHAIHHAHNGNLCERGHGDIDVLTVREYLSKSKYQRLRYWIYRHPFGYLGLGPFFFFLFVNRLVLDRKKTNGRERANVYWTNAVLLAAFVFLGQSLGWMTLVKVGLPMLYIAGGAGIWLFYIQHQFEHTYWQPKQNWDYVTAAMQGSSFYKLPKVLQWFTGNIGFHHIHHLRPAIPNYQLEACHTQIPEVQNVPTLTFRTSFKTMFLILWDETQQRLISYREFKELYGNAC